MEGIKIVYIVIMGFIALAIVFWAGYSWERKRANSDKIEVKVLVEDYKDGEPLLLVTLPKSTKNNPQIIWHGIEEVDELPKPKPPERFSHMNDYWVVDRTAHL